LAQRLLNTPLVITLGETLAPGLARAVVRNWWPWIKAKKAQDITRGAVGRKRPLLVVLQAGREPAETAALVRFFRAPWRQTPVVVIDDDGGSELALRGEGVACFLSGSQVEPELIEELAESLVAQHLESAKPARTEPAPAQTEPAKRLA
jgi:hypothetical protein